jgi:hypothetical protein
MGHRTPLGAAAAAAAVLLAGTAPAPLHAQDGFLFRAPQAQLTVRVGPSIPRAQSDIFDDMTTMLTLERADFRAPSLSADLALLLGSRFDAALGIGWAESHARSEFRDLIGSDGLPIEQTTRLQTIPLTTTLRYYPLARGTTLTTLAWLPTRTTPYIGGGGGVTWYRLQQEGEFVHSETHAIFLQEYESRDRSLTAHLVAGLDHWFTPRVALNAEARYTRGAAPVGGDYRDFDSMDLSGVQVGLGLSYRW